MPIKCAVKALDNAVHSGEQFYKTFQYNILWLMTDLTMACEKRIFNGYRWKIQSLPNLMMHLTLPHKEKWYDNRENEIKKENISLVCNIRIVCVKQQSILIAVRTCITFIAKGNAVLLCSFPINIRQMPSRRNGNFDIVWPITIAH